MLLSGDSYWPDPNLSASVTQATDTPLAQVIRFRSFLDTWQSQIAFIRLRTPSAEIISATTATILGILSHSTPPFADVSLKSQLATLAKDLQARSNSSPDWCGFSFYHDIVQFRLLSSTLGNLMMSRLTRTRFEDRNGIQQSAAAMHPLTLSWLSTIRGRSHKFSTLASLGLDKFSSHRCFLVSDETAASPFKTVPRDRLVLLQEVLLAFGAFEQAIKDAKISQNGTIHVLAVNLISNPVLQLSSLLPDDFECSVPLTGLPAGYQSTQTRCAVIETMQSVDFVTTLSATVSFSHYMV